MSVNKVELHRQIVGDMNKIYQKKNHDYGDSFSELYSEYGLLSSVIRLDDKLKRLKQLTRSEAQLNESIDDTLLDLANYAVMTLIERKVEQAPDIKKLLERGEHDDAYGGCCGCKAIMDEDRG